MKYLAWDKTEFNVQAVGEFTAYTAGDSSRNILLSANVSVYLNLSELSYNLSELSYTLSSSP